MIGKTLQTSASISFQNKEDRRARCVGCRVYAIETQALERLSRGYIDTDYGERQRQFALTLMDRAERECRVLRESGHCQLLAPPPVTVVVPDRAALSQLRWLPVDGEVRLLDVADHES